MDDRINACGGRAGEVQPRSTPEALLDRIRNDRFGKDQLEKDRYAVGWNAASEHIERIVERWLCERADERPVLTGLRELRDAPAIDLRLKNALIGDC